MGTTEGKSPLNSDPSDVVVTGESRLSRLNRIVCKFWWVILLLVIARILEILKAPDGDLYYFTTSAQSHGGILGWSTPWAYPPLAGVIVSPLKFLGLANATAYFVVAISLPVIFLVMYSFWRSRLPYWPLAVAYFSMGTVFLGLVFFYRFDSVTVLLSILALLALGQQREYISGFLLTLAAFVKGWPFLLLGAIGGPLGRWRILIPALISICAATLLGFITQSVPWSWITFAQGRGLHAESFAALPALWAQYFGVEEYAVDLSPGSWVNATGPHLGWGLVILVLSSGIAFSLLTFMRLQVLRDTTSGFWTQPKLAYLLFCITLLLVISPVLSPQFVLWIVPPICVAIAYGWLRREALLSLVALGLSGLIYPPLYTALMADLDLFPLLVLTTRDAVLLAIAGSAAYRVWTAPTLSPKPIIPEDA